MTRNTGPLLIAFMALIATSCTMGFSQAAPTAGYPRPQYGQPTNAAAPQATSGVAYDLSRNVGIDSFDVTGVPDQIVTVRQPQDWKWWQAICSQNCSGATVAFKPAGSEAFTQYYRVDDLANVHLSNREIIVGPGWTTEWQMKFVCPDGACPVLHYVKLASPGTDNGSSSPVAAAPSAQPTAQPASEPSPAQTPAPPPAAASSDFVSQTLPILVYGAIFLAIVWWIVARRRRKKRLKESEPSSEPEPVAAIETEPARYINFDVVDSTFKESIHTWTDISRDAAIMFTLWLPIEYDKKDNQDKIATHARSLLSAYSFMVTPYQVPDGEPIDEAISKDLSVFVRSIGIPAYSFCFAIRHVDSIVIGLRDDATKMIDTLPYSARNKHVYVAGKSGSGKSTLLRSLAAQDIAQGKSLAVIDPHGDLANALLQCIPAHQVNRAIYIDAENAVPIDFMSYDNEREKEALVGDIIFLLQRFPGWGPRMDAILRNVLYTLLEAGDTCFLDIYNFLVDPERRKEILSRVHDADLLRTWRDDFPRRDALEPIITRMTSFVRSPSLKTFMGGGTKQLDLHDVMETGKILLVNLVTAGRESGDLLGALIVSKLQQAAMRRHHIPPEKRRPFYLYTDEFQRFQTTSFDIILSETRKYEVGLVMANQFVDQLDSKILSSVIGNVSTFVLFQLDPRDARHFLSGVKRRLTNREITDRMFFNNPKGLNIDDWVRERVPFEPDGLSNLATGHALYKAENGNANITRVIPLTFPSHHLGDQIKANTLAQYGTNRTELSPSSNSPQLSHTEGDEKPDPDYGPAIPFDES